MNKVNYNLVLLLSFSIFLWQCKIYKINENGYVRPKKEKYKLKGKLVPDDLTKQIDTNSIYVAFDLPGNYSDTLFTFLKFYSDGRVLLGYYNNSNKKLEALESFYDCYVGYYSTKNDELLLELFGLYSDRLGNYATYNCSINNGLILMKKEKLRSGAVIRMNKIFIRENGNILLKPDW